MSNLNRQPQLGDVVLIRGVIVEPPHESREDCALVEVRSRGGDFSVYAHTSAIATVMGPAWFPPRVDDVVLDRNGEAWQLAAPETWRPVGATDCVTTDDLVRLLGPLTLVARARRAVSS